MDATSPWSRRAALIGMTAAGACGTARGQAGIPEAPAAQLESAFDRAARVSAPVYVNGAGPFPFVVDTGANRSVISEETARACALPVDGRAPVHGILGVWSAPLARVRRLQVGEVRSTDQRLPLLPEAALGVGGLLGVDMLRGRRTVLDFARRGFAISPSGEGPPLTRMTDSRIPSPSEPVSVPARFRFGQLIIIDAAAGASRVTVFLDTGSQVTVGNMALRASALRAQPRLGAALLASTLTSATGQTAMATFGPLPGLRLGRLAVEAPFVAFADLHIFALWGLQERPALLLGMDLLRRFPKIEIDYGAKSVTLWPGRGRAYY